MAATQEYYEAQKQMSEMMSRVLKLAKMPENKDALPGLRHMLLGDVGMILVNTLQGAGFIDKDAKLASPETLLTRHLKAQEPVKEL